MTPTALSRPLRRDESEDAVLVETDLETEPASESIEPDSADALESGSDSEVDKRGKRAGRPGGMQWRRALTYGILPGLALTLAMAAGYLKWYDSSARDSRLAASESVRAASDGAIAMLSYRPDTVDKDLGAARDRLNGALKDSYSSLTHDLVIPGSKQKMISATATVPSAASVSASPNRAVVLIFVNQTIMVGSDPPTNTASRVRVTLDKVDGRWLISRFEPI
jgi:Mce-associated membrane protein